MSKLIKLSDSKNAPVTRTFKEIRADYNLSRAQAAIAMGVSRASIENWERKPCTNIDDVAISAKFLKYSKEQDITQKVGRNLIFDRYPLRMAREILELKAGDIAHKYGYSESAWKKFEGNGRPLNVNTMRKLENDVRVAFLSCCP